MTMSRVWLKQNALRHLAWAGTLVLVLISVVGTTNTPPDAQRVVAVGARSDWQ